MLQVFVWILGFKLVKIKMEISFNFFRLILLIYKKIIIIIYIILIINGL